MTSESQAIDGKRRKGYRTRMIEEANQQNPIELSGRAAHRAEIVERAHSQMADIGVDAALIDRLVETFYSHIRQHPQLGPAFEAKLAGRWPAHMAKMKGFWSSMAFKTGAYGGKPVAAHQGVPDMSAAMFDHWLTLFSATLTEIGASTAAHAWFMDSATRIARSLAASLFVNPKSGISSPDGA